MQDFSVLKSTEIVFCECQYCDRLTFCRYEFNFKSTFVIIAMHNCANITGFEIMLFNIMSQSTKSNSFIILISIKGSVRINCDKTRFCLIFFYNPNCSYIYNLIIRCTDYSVNNLLLSNKGDGTSSVTSCVWAILLKPPSINLNWFH